MSKDSIRLVISAKDMASGVLGRVKASTIALGTAAGNLLSRGMTAAMNGIRGMLNGALEAERANVMLDAALRGVGKYTPQLAKQYRDLAAAIQNETGTSDEAVKANIALLTSMGVASGKMDTAARSVQALTSLNVEGAMAAKAVARAMDGDIAGFERLAPAVRTATTIAEKYAAANQMISAGYAQQEAKLQTVGGAWEALKGRIGDATEDIIGAIFQGAKLGTTFNEMQASVGKFLSSDAFKGFTDKLAAGAGHVREIVRAMSAGGGTKEVAGAMGNVILAALKDGAEYVGAKISNAFAGAKSLFGESRVKLATMAWTPEDEARRAVYGDKQPVPKASNLAAALKALSATVRNNVSKLEASADSSDEVAVTMKQVAEATKEEKRVVLDGTEALKKIEDEKNKQFAWELEISGYKAQQAAAEQKAAKLAEQEADAKRRASDSQNAAKKIASVGIADWLENSRAANEELKDRQKRDAAERKRMERLQRVVDSGGRLSKSNQQDLDNAKRKKNQADALRIDADRARAESIQLANDRRRIEQEARTARNRIVAATEGMRADLKRALELN